MNDEPRAWMRRYAYDRENGTVGNRPKHWMLQPVTEHKLFEDDVPLFARYPGNAAVTPTPIEPEITGEPS